MVKKCSLNFFSYSYAYVAATYFTLKDLLASMFLWFVYHIKRHYFNFPSATVRSLMHYLALCNPDLHNWHRTNNTILTTTTTKIIRITIDVLGSRKLQKDSILGFVLYNNRWWVAVEMCREKNTPHRLSDHWMCVCVGVSCRSQSGKSFAPENSRLSDRLSGLVVTLRLKCFIRCPSLQLYIQ